jgi:hypothetical protein
MKVRTILLIIVAVLALSVIAFIITINTAKPAELHLNMPKDSDIEESKQTTVAGCILTLLLDKNSTVYVYNDDDIKKIIKTVLSSKELTEFISTGKRTCDSNLLVILKPTETATYKSTVDLLDMMTIHTIKKYSMVKPTNRDIEALNNFKQ